MCLRRPPIQPSCKWIGPTSWRRAGLLSWTGPGPLSRPGARTRPPLQNGDAMASERIVGGFPGDGNVVGMGFPEPSSRDLKESGFGSQLLQVPRATISHAAANPTHQLEHRVREWALVGNPCLDPFPEPP